MNNEGSKKHYVITLTILFVAMIAVIVLTIANNTMKKEKPITVAAYSEISTTTTAPSDEIKDKTKDELQVGNEPVVVTNFQAPLSQIDAYNVFAGATSNQFKYSGAAFNYSCSEADGNICKVGALTMNVGTTMLPIYSFDNPSGNYGTTTDSLYIIVNDNNIIILFNANTNSGFMKVYSRTGNYIGQVDGVASTIAFDANGTTKVYPYIGDGLNFYTCAGGGVYQKNADLNNLANQRVITQVEGAFCS